MNKGVARNPFANGKIAITSLWDYHKQSLYMQFSRLFSVNEPINYFDAPEGFEPSTRFLEKSFYPIELRSLRTARPVLYFFAIL